MSMFTIDIFSGREVIVYVLLELS